MKDAEWVGLATAVAVLVIAVAVLWWVVQPAGPSPMT